MKVLVVIVNYGEDFGDLKECLESLDSNFPASRQGGRWNDNVAIEVCIVINPKKSILTNTNQYYQILTNTNKKRNIKIKKIIRNDKNVGFAAGVNCGVKWGMEKNYDLFWMLNPDTKIILNFKFSILNQNLNSKFQNTGRFDVFSPVIYDTQGKIWFTGGKINRWTGECTHSRAINKKSEIDESVEQWNGDQCNCNHKDKQENWNLDSRLRGNDSTAETEWVSGCSMFVKREVFEKIGLFDEKFFLFYEDVDFCLRARAAGFRIGVARIGGVGGLEGIGDLKVIHKVSQSVKNLPGKYEIEMQSKFHLLKKHGNYFYPTAFMMSWVRMVMHRANMTGT